MKVKKIICIFLVVFLVSGCTIKNINDSENEKNNSKILYEKCDVLESSNSELATAVDGTIYLGEKEIYTCSDDYNCDVYASQSFSYCNKTDHIIAIKDNERAILYDYKENKKIIEADSLYFLDEMTEDKDYYRYLLYKVNDKVGILDYKGNELVKADLYTNIANSTYTYRGEYNLKNKFVSATVNGKVGIINIETGEIIEDFLHDYIRIYENYFVFIDDGLATITDKEKNIINEKMYNNILVVNDIFVFEKANYIRLSNKKLENLSGNIKIYKPYTNSDDSGYFLYVRNNNEVEINVIVDNDVETYIYNIKKKKFV